MPKAREFIKTPAPSRDTKSRITEDPAWVAAHEENAMRQALDKGYHKRLEDGCILKEYLDGVSLSLIQDILETIAGRAGLKKEEMNTAIFDRILYHSINFSSPTAFFDLEDNIVYINNVYTANEVAEYRRLLTEISSIGPTRAEEIIAVVVTAHELIHGFAKGEIEGLREFTEGSSDTRDLREIRKRNGYLTERVATYEVRGQALNEAVIMRLTHEIVSEYFKRTHEPLTEPEQDALSKFGVYKKEQEILDGVTARLAKDAGVDKRTVWHGLLRDLFHGTDFESPSFKAHLARIFGKGFVADLAQLNIHDEKRVLDDFINKYRLSEELGS